jgi:hypothetical protein
LPGTRPVLASADVQLQVTRDTAAREAVHINADEEAACMLRSVYLDRNLKPAGAVQAANSADVAQCVTPCAPTTLEACAPQAPTLTYTPQRKEHISLPFTLRTLCQFGRESKEGCTDAIAAAISSRLLTAAEELSNWIKPCNYFPSGASIALFKLPSQAVPLAVLLPVSEATPETDERLQEALQSWRKALHVATLCPMDTPLFRISQQLSYSAPPLHSHSHGDVAARLTKAPPLYLLMRPFHSCTFPLVPVPVLSCRAAQQCDIPPPAHALTCSEAICSLWAFVALPSLCGGLTCGDSATQVRRL